MLRHPDYTRARIKQLAERMRGKIYFANKPIDQLLVSERIDRISYSDAQKLKKFRPTKIGDQFGPLWATYWFRAAAKRAGGTLNMQSGSRRRSIRGLR